MKYLIGLLITIAVIIFIIIRLLSGGGGDVELKAELSSYASTDTVMRLTIQNPVQASQTHRVIQVTVGRDEATLVVYRGYEGAVMRSKTYAMSEPAYTDFLRGLQISGRYTEGNDDPAVQNEHGYCALGDRFVYEIIDGDNNVIQHYWSTDCGIQTFEGDPDTVQRLFRLQIPDYDELTTDVEL